MSALRSALRKALRSALRPMTGYPTDDGYSWSFLSSLPDGWLFTRASAAQTGTDSAGLLVTTSSNDVPAYRYGEGVLLEGSRTNLLRYSAQFGGTNWTKRGTATATQNSAVAPDGTSTATLIAGIGSVGTNDIYQIVTEATASAALAPSIWIKKVSLTGVIYLANPASSSYGAWNINLALLGNEWERITSTHPAVTIINPFIGSPSNQAGLQFAATAGAPLSLYTGNTMIEIGAFSSSDIPTTTGSVTRAATSLTKSHTLPVNDFAGQIKVRPRFASTDTGAYPTVVAFYYNDDNSIQLLKDTASSTLLIVTKTSGNSSTASVSGLSWGAGDLLNIRFRKSGSGVKAWINAASGSVTSAAAQANFGFSPTTIRLGANPSNGSLGNITAESLKIWHEAKSDAFMESLQ